MHNNDSSLNVTNGQNRVATFARRSRSIAFAALGAAVVISPMAAAEDTDVSTNRDGQIVVPIEDATGRSMDAVGFRAADLSMTGITLVIFGGTSKMYEAANSSIFRARNQGVPSGILLADRDPRLMDTPSTAIYVGGIKMFPSDGESEPAPVEHRGHSYYYTANMSGALDAYKQALSTQSQPADE